MAAVLTEASNVQDPNEVGRGLKRETLVDSLDHVIEEAAVHGLGQSVPRVVGLFHLQRHPGARRNGGGKVGHRVRIKATGGPNCVRSKHTCS